MPNNRSIFDKYDRQPDLDNNSGDRALVNWIKSKHAAHAQSLQNFGEIFVVIQEEP